MAILEENATLLEALRGAMTPKFLATRSAEGKPNVVPLVSLAPADDQPDVLTFGNFLLRKSIANLKENPRVGILVITPGLEGWRLRGDFVEFQRTGPYVDRQKAGPLLRYNAYTGVRDAGVIRLRDLRGSFRISRPQVLSDYLLARFAALGHARRPTAGARVPAAVRKEFGRMVAVKVMAWIGEDGYPEVVPMLSMQPAGARALVGWRGGDALPTPPEGATVAANILTFEAISYQAKGRWHAGGRSGAIEVSEVYAGGPPIPGGRVV
jgi:hypothetical protein